MACPVCRSVPLGTMVIPAWRHQSFAVLLVLFLALVEGSVNTTVVLAKNIDVMFETSQTGTKSPWIVQVFPEEQVITNQTGLSRQ